MSFLLWNRLPNIGMGSKGLRSGFFFLILKLKQSHCLHMETLQTVLSIILMRNPMCGGHLKPRQLMCVIRNCVSHSSGEWGWTPASGAHAWGLHCGAIPKQDSLVWQAQSCHDGLSFHEGHWAGSVKHFRMIISLNSVSALWPWRLPPCLIVSRLESFPFHPSVVLFLLSIQSRQGAQTGYHCSATSLS